MKFLTCFWRRLSLLGATFPLPASLLAAPVVSDVSYVQQPGSAGATQVRVTYNLASPNGDAAVSLLYSIDGGSSFIPAITTTGAVGAGISPGMGKQIDWAVATDLPGQQLTGNFVVRVLAEDGVAIPLVITSDSPSDVHQLETQILTFTFAEPIVGFDASDVIITGGTQGTFAGSGAVYTLEVTGTGGTVTASVAAGAATSVASGTTTLGNSFSNFYQDTWTISLPGDVPMELIRIPAGTFTMGSPVGELSRNSDETEHTVTISQDFYIGKTEVTQNQWVALQSFPATQSFAGGTMPVHNVSHTDIDSWMTALNAHVTEPGTFGLPTESQWEYACRAGSSTRFTFGDGLHPTNDEGCGATSERTDNMWYCGNNSPGGTKTVGQKQPNAWGLYDMHGNVAEWCADWYDAYPTGSVIDPTGPPSGSSRVHRGGSWPSEARFCRSALRSASGPSNRFFNFGFRVVAIR